MLTEGISSADLNPKNISYNEKVLLNANTQDPAPFSSYLALEIFDNEEYDCRTPSEWLHLGEEEGILKPIPGFAFLPNCNHGNCKLF